MNLTKEQIEQLAESKFGTEIDSVRGSRPYDLEADRKNGYVQGFQDCQERDKWISVETKPIDSECTSYLCYDKYHCQRRVLVFNPFHECWDSEDGDDYYTDLIGGKVTYYQPLPTLPKEKGGDGE